jgi:hypothetical protein
MLLTGEQQVVKIASVALTTKLTQRRTFPRGLGGAGGVEEAI